MRYLKKFFRLSKWVHVITGTIILLSTIVLSIFAF